MAVTIVLSAEVECCMG